MRGANLLDVSQTYGLPRPLTGIALPYLLSYLAVLLIAYSIQRRIVG
jgi:hypothetical protein